MTNIKYLLWRWLICPWRVYYHLRRWSNTSAAVKYIRFNTGWRLKKCAEYVDNKRGRHVWYSEACEMKYKIWS